MGYIPRDKLENLKKYKYSGVDKSILSRYVLSPFWTFFVSLWPKTVAPNTITFSGLCLVMFNLATLVYYDPYYLTDWESAGPPKWVYFTWAAGLFWYQTFDAIDGKQARRTGMAGPLGELFDHGCDAMNTTFEIILAARAFNLGRNWWTVAAQIGGVGNFYLSTWEEFHTGTLYLSAFSGPVEGIIIVVMMYVITGIFGPSVWDEKFLAVTKLDRLMAAYAPQLLYKVPNLSLNEAFYAFGAVGLLFNIIMAYRNVWKARRAINKNPITPAGRLVPLFVTVFLHTTWIKASGPLEGNSGQAYILNSECFLPFLVFWGFEFAHQVGKMILAHLTKQRFPYWDWSWVFVSLATVDANAQYLLGRPPLIQSTPERTLAFILFSVAVAVCTYGRFCYMVINEITDFLGIACFTVRKKDHAGHWVNAEEVNAKNV